MVIIVSRFTDFDTERLERTRVLQGPLYDGNEVKSVLKPGSDSVVVWTTKAVKDVGNLAFDSDDIAKLICKGIDDKAYKNSEWCQQSPNGPWAACDVYVVKRVEFLPSLAKDMELEYYIKFAIGKTGKIILVVSFHL